MKRYRGSFRPQSQKPSTPSDPKVSNGPVGILPWTIRRLADGQVRGIEGGVVIEEPLEIRLNNRTVAVLMRTPGMEKELAAGFCLGEGLVASLGDLALVHHCGRSGPPPTTEGVARDALDESRNRVDVTLMPGSTASVTVGDGIQLVRSGCGRTEVGSLIENLAPVENGVCVQVETLRHLPAQITRRQSAYRLAGGIHAAAVFDHQGQAIVVCEDVGRHNAVDKAVGYCLLRGIPLRDKLLVSTGRASYDMVAKGVRLRVPIIASISSPTSLAVELADALNTTLLGYLRGNTLNVYSHPWRVTLSTGDEASDP